MTTRAIPRTIGTHLLRHDENQVIGTGSSTYLVTHRAPGHAASKESVEQRHDYENQNDCRDYGNPSALHALTLLARGVILEQGTDM
jgi:hypothetical protein